MAISDLLPRKIKPTRTLHDRHDYDQNPKKTRDGELVSSYKCSPESAAEKFEISKQLYVATTGRSQPKKRDIIMYRIIQSFKPGEISPEDANRIGYELAMAFTKGKHPFAEIEKREAAKAAFDDLGGAPVPRVAQFSEEYAALLAEKNERYTVFQEARSEMVEYRTAQQNVDRILGLEQEQTARNDQRDTGRG